ncbi:hypothetical protein EPN18_09655, partial [bacterium]
MLKIRLSLVQKAIISFAVIFAPIAITFFIGYRDNKEHYKKLIINDLVVIAEAYEAQIFQFLEMNKQRAIDFSTDGTIVKEVENAAAGRPYSSALLGAHLLRNKAPLDKTIQEVLVISPLGRVIASTNNELIGADVSDKPFFLKGKTNAEMVETAATANNARGL